MNFCHNWCHHYLYCPVEECTCWCVQVCQMVQSTGQSASTIN